MHCFCCRAGRGTGLPSIRTDLYFPQTQSKKGADLIYKYPILLDACANEMQAKGDSMMSKWAEVRHS